MPRLKSTLRSRFWIDFIASFRHCYSCGGPLGRKYVTDEKTRRHVCAKCGQITYLNPKVVAGLIPVTSDGKVILIKRAIEPAKGRWTYPAGFQEMGETVATAAARETSEEACADVTVTRLVGIYSYADAGVVTIVYEGRLKPTRTPKAGHEALAIGLFKPEEIPWKTLAFRSTIDALRDWKLINKRPGRGRKNSI